MPFPCWKHHPDGRSVKVVSQEQMDNLKMGPEWADKPYPKIERPEPPVECPNCERIRASFNKSYDELIAQHRDLQASHEKVNAMVRDLKAANEKLTLENELLRKEQGDTQSPIVPAQPVEVNPEPAPEPPAADAAPAKKPKK